MPVSEITRAAGASQVGLSGYSVEFGACSSAFARLPGLLAYMDPDGLTCQRPGSEERVNGILPVPGEPTAGAISQTLPAQQFNSRNVFNFLLSTQRGKTFYKVPSQFDMSFVGAILPGANTLNGAKSAGICWITDSGLVTRRWLQIAPSGSAQHPASILQSSGGADGVMTNAIGLADLAGLAPGKRSVIAAVWSTSRRIMECYVDDMSTPAFTGAMPVPSITGDGQVEIGGFGGDASSWKGLMGRCAVVGFDLGSPAGKPLLQSAAAALVAYYAAAGT